MDTHTVLSLYSGGGGLDLGFKLAVPGARTVCYVERDAAACALLVDHMQTGQLDDAPLWSDSGTFDGRPWRGVVDWIIGGPPCQPFSDAGLRLGADDPRNQWPTALGVVSDIAPEFCFFENVASADLIWYVYEEVEPCLRALGYEVEIGIFSAVEIGATHRRRRIFIMANRSSERCGETREYLQQSTSWLASESPALGDTDQQGLQGRRRDSERAYERPAWPPGPSDTDAWAAVLRERPDLAPAITRAAERADLELFLDIFSAAKPCPDGDGRWHFDNACVSPEYWRTLARIAAKVESEVRGMADGTPRGLVGLGRTDQLRILGNGCVPAQAALAFELLMNRSTK